jgi:hypothetical protein
MSSYNQRGQQYGGNRGEYNNDDAANQQEKQGQQQEFVSPSLCIPRTHANIRKERIFAVIRSLGLGWIGRIDVVEKKDEKTGTPFIRVFIHFKKWFQNAQTRQFLEHLETQKSANIVYDEPWFWKVTKSFVPAPPMPAPQQQQQQQPSRFPRPRIDFDGGASSTRVQQEGQEQEQQEQQEQQNQGAVVASKTPSSNSSGTNAVSGKGKQVAKRMGYESGKGLGKKADGRLVPVQIKKNVGRNGIGLGSDACAVAVAAAVDVDVASVDAVVETTSSDYWTTHAHEGYTKCAFPKVLEQISLASAASAVEPRLSVSVSPPKLERRLFHDCCDDDDVASVGGCVYKMNMNKSNSA